MRDGLIRNYNYMENNICLLRYKKTDWKNRIMGGIAKKTLLMNVTL